MNTMMNINTPEPMEDVIISNASFIHFLEDFFHTYKYEPQRLGQAFCGEYGVSDSKLFHMENNGHCVDYILDNYVEDTNL